MTQPWLIWPGLLFLALYLGLYVALFGWIVRVVRRRLGLSIFLIAPFAWTAVEWLKSVGELGCPWGDLGYALARQPAWIQGASVVGASGLSTWIVAVNALLAAAIAKFVSRRFVEGALRLALGLAIFILPPVWGSKRLHGAAATPPAAESGLGRVALVQPNIPSDTKWNPAFQDSVVESIYRLTQQAVATGSDSTSVNLVVWPETALPFYVRLEPLKLRRLLMTAKEMHVPILAGYPDARLKPGGDDVATFNAAGLVLASGTISGQYEKIHLVPFGERIPFQSLFPFLGHFDLGQAEWTPGTHALVFTGAGPPFGVLICFESIFASQARVYRDQGATYLVNITNDEWFGRSAGPVQHADLAILRSAELGMGLVRAANTGISMIVDPYGRVVAETRLFEVAVLRGEIPTPLPPTPYARYGDWVALLSIAIVLLVLAVSWFRPVGMRADPLTTLKSPPTFPGA